MSRDTEFVSFLQPGSENSRKKNGTCQPGLKGVSAVCENITHRARTPLFFPLSYGKESEQGFLHNGERTVSTQGLLVASWPMCRGSLRCGRLSSRNWTKLSPARVTCSGAQGDRRRSRGQAQCHRAAQAARPGRGRPPPASRKRPFRFLLDARRAHTGLPSARRGGEEAAGAFQTEAP